MEVTTNYSDMTKCIYFESGENPLELVPDGWEVVERREPNTFRGFVNPGCVVCQPPTKVGE